MQRMVFNQIFAACGKSIINAYAAIMCANVYFLLLVSTKIIGKRKAVLINWNSFIRNKSKWVKI